LHSVDYPLVQDPLPISFTKDFFIQKNSS